ncbi:MAG: hypothetical protein L3J82_02435 [Planctomycetes bacterium]|nr:hypothetical protein [Planctomycetota bacterium]
MDNSPVRRWFEDKTKAESNGTLLHAIFLLAMFPVACFFLFIVLICSGYLFAIFVPKFFYGVIAANFLVYPIVRLKMKLKDNKSGLNVVLTVLFFSPHLLWESISEFWSAYRIRNMSVSPFLNLLQAAWGSEGKVSIDALSSDEGEAERLALVLAKFPEVYYLHEERTISFSDKALAQMSIIEMAD